MGSNTGNDDINNTYHIKMAVLEELRHTLKVKRINDELLEHLASTLRWPLRYGEINSIILPEKDKIALALERAMEIAEKLPSHQPNCNNQNKQSSNQHYQKLGNNQNFSNVLITLRDRIPIVSC